jgi:hypothetical protein
MQAAGGAEGGIDSQQARFLIAGECRVDVLDGSGERGLPSRGRETAWLGPRRDDLISVRRARVERVADMDPSRRTFQAAEPQADSCPLVMRQTA